MERIARENVAAVATKSGGGPRAQSSERVYQEMLLLAVGEALRITKREWGIKSPPSWNVNKVAARRGSKARFTCRMLTDETGWLIKRIK
ncbi:hypothetical protein [Bradyrhizobium elkanii]|uniref:hypothetical protein n=1 Tax=Bradyrhizobium elkanii TaxID=29448 RepID=UPI003D23F849